MTAPEVLYVDDEEHLRRAASQTFALADITCQTLDHADAALSMIATGFDGVLVTDIRMPNTDGVTLMRKALELDPNLPIILVTGFGDVSLAVDCIKAGAYDFLEKPCDPEQLIACVERALERRRLIEDNAALRAQLGAGDIIEKYLPGRSRIIKELRAILSTVAATDTDVLITGETGTGKEQAARALHAASDRGVKPFVHINCAALPETMIESELFGYEAGAFPGATRPRFGKLEHARGGTLCLDEIDSLPVALQGKLLDVLHNRVITRLGSNDPIPLDMRVIAISKSDLDAAVAEGRFRSDLFYRLNVVTLNLPRLADRREDIPLLFSLLVQDTARRLDRSEPEVSAALLSHVAAQPWSGNIRELRNFAERHVLGLSNLSSASETAVTLADQMNAYEKSLISAAIAAHDGRLKAVYESLGLSRKTLYDKMQKHGLSREDFAKED